MRTPLPPNFELSPCDNTRAFFLPVILPLIKFWIEIDQNRLDWIKVVRYLIDY